MTYTIPALTEKFSQPLLVLDYLNELKKSGFSGDIETSYASRLAVATDNSVYQMLPQAVILPKNTEDVVLMMQKADSDKYKTLKFSPRGGGTGTNGQSLTEHIVVDMSRHMRRILEINIEEQYVRVQSGVIKDALNDVLKPYGYFFAPELSTSNRATIGGMISTDACGQGSLRYGKTSNHVLGLTSVCVDGSLINSAPESVGQQIDGEKAKTIAQQAMQETARICRDNRQLIKDKFPPLNRFLTGYDLDHVYNDAMDTFDLSRILCGAEGTLAFITEAKLNITKIPTSRVLVNVKYDSFDSALRNAPTMVAANALSVETVDSKVLNLAREDIVWYSVTDLIADVPGKELQGINIVEFAGDDPDENLRQVKALTEKLDTFMLEGKEGIIGYQVCDELDEILKIYAMRKKAVGLLGATQGAQKPIAFTEDTCVPPENLADYIAEFRALLDEKGLHYGMFGHVDSGVLHVRPALDMNDPEQELMMQSLSDEIVALVSKYGGLMWGEHGKGFRSQYSPEFFGEALYTELRKIKAAFDPSNRINPGKVCVPYGCDDELVKVSARKRAYYDRQIPVEIRDTFSGALECNGNGLCFNYDTSSPMCPSYKIYTDRRMSPKGRAGIVREWLRQLAEAGVDLKALEDELMSNTPSIKAIYDRVRRTSPQALMGKKGAEQASLDRHYDFSHEVMEAMNTCLACKACASQCPVKVDVSSFRSRFMNIYYSRYQRPVKDYLVSGIEFMLPWMAKVPVVTNTLIKPKLMRNLVEKTLGYVDAPLLSVPKLDKMLEGQDAKLFDFRYLQGLTADERKDYVLIIQDPFTSFYDAKTVYDLIRLIEHLGKKPLLVPFKPNGKAQHIKGFLRKFAKTAQSTSDFLNQLAELNLPMVGLDPALVLCYRDEYKEILGDRRGAFKVSVAHEYLLPVMRALFSEKKECGEIVTQDPTPWYLFAHCTEKTMLPNAEKEWQEIFAYLGLILESAQVGCCGMAGTFGHEADKKDDSLKIYNLSWKPKLKELPIERCLVTGYSCRSQVARNEHQRVLHPVQALLKYID